MYNKVVLVGNLTRDIELKYLQSGTAIGNTAIATSRKFKGSDGSQKEEVCFIDVSAFGRTAEVMNQYLKKGSKVLVDGRLKLDQWQDQNGNKRSKHSVIVESMQMLDSRGDNNSNNSYNSAPPQQNNSYNQQQSAPANTPRVQEQQPSSIPEIDIDDDEIPF